MPELSVVLPCYNEAGNIPAILDRFRPLTEKISLELVLVDNGSTDATAQVLARELAQSKNTFARSVKVEQNVGYGHGIQSGLEKTLAHTVAFSHADLQCPPEHLLEAFQIYKQQRVQGPCLVMGRRVGKRPRLDRFVTSLYNRLAHEVLNLESFSMQKQTARWPDINAQPKLFDRGLVRALVVAPQDFTYDLFILESCRRKGIRIIEFDTTYETRQWGKSKLAANPWVRLKTSLNAFRKILALRHIPKQTKILA